MKKKIVLSTIILSQSRFQPFLWRSALNIYPTILPVLDRRTVSNFHPWSLSVSVLDQKLRYVYNVLYSRQKSINQTRQYFTVCTVIFNLLKRTSNSHEPALC